MIRKIDMPTYIMGIITLLLYYPMWINNPHITSGLAIIALFFAIIAYGFSFLISTVIFTVSSACGALCIFYFPSMLSIENVGYIAFLGAAVGSFIIVLPLLAKEDFMVFVAMLVSVIAFYYVSTSVILLSNLAEIGGVTDPVYHKDKDNH